MTAPAQPFIVKHYSADERPIIKGNGFDGLEVGETREDAEEFVAWINARLALAHRADVARVATPNTLTKLGVNELERGDAGYDDCLSALPADGGGEL